MTLNRDGEAPAYVRLNASLDDRILSLEKKVGVLEERMKSLTRDGFQAPSGLPNSGVPLVLTAPNRGDLLSKDAPRPEGTSAEEARGADLSYRDTSPLTRMQGQQIVRMCTALGWDYPERLEGFSINDAIRWIDANKPAYIAKLNAAKPRVTA